MGENADQLNILMRALEQVQADNSDLRQENRRLRADLRVARAGGHLIDEMRVIALEAEQAKDERDHLARILINLLNSVSKEVVQTKAEAERGLKTLNEVFQSQETLYIARVLEDISRQYSETQQGESDQLMSAVVKYTGSNEYDPIHNAEFCFAQLLNLIRMNESWHIVGLFVNKIYEYADDKRLLAAVAIVQCQDSGKPSMNVIERLGVNWLKDRLPDPPSSLAKLAEGLEWAQQQKDSGEPIKTYADFNDISDKTLRKFVSWYEALDEFSHATKVTDFLPPDVTISES